MLEDKLEKVQAEYRAAKDRLLNRGLYGGINNAELDVFQIAEGQKADQGLPRLETLDLPSRVYNKWRRMGVRTTEGVVEALRRGMVPYRLGTKSLNISVDRYNEYAAQHGEEPATPDACLAAMREYSHLVSDINRRKQEIRRLQGIK